MTNNRWIKMFDTKNYTYWKQQDESGMNYYNVSLVGEPMEIEAGGYYNINSLMHLKNDNSETVEPLEQLASAIYNTLEQVESVVKKSEYFKNLWDNPDSNMYDFYPCCNEIRLLAGLPEYSESMFEAGWQFRTVCQENFDDAVIEFSNLIIGWW